MRSYRSLALLLFCLLAAGAAFAQGLPIKATRTVSFDTDEGSYMDVDITADGKRLVFDLLGDLYSVSAEGGEAKQITRGLALHYSPRWSPDGRKIACLSDHSGILHAAVVDAATGFHATLGNSGGQTLNDNDVVTWTSDGRFVNVRDSVYGVAGGEEWIGVRFEKFLRFSVDGRFLYGIDSGRVYRYEPATSSKIVVGEAPGYNPENCWNPILSPDAHWLGFMADLDKKRALVVCNLISGRRQILVRSLVAGPYYGTHSPGIRWPGFCFSPDSRSVYIGYAGKLHRINVESSSDQVVPFMAHVRADLGPMNYNTYRIMNNKMVQVKYIRHGSLRPDGKQLVFSALGRVYVMDLPSGRPRVLAEQGINQFEPEYSPDGQWIAYVSWNDTVGGYLWRVPVAGGRPEQLTSTAGCYDLPTWSPDGNWIAVIIEKGKVGLYSGIRPKLFGRVELVSIGDGNVRLIEDSVQTVENNLAFSADGQRILFSPGEGRRDKNPLKSQLVSRDLKGGNREVIAVGSNPTFYSTKYLSPDGKFVVWSANESLYLLPVYEASQPLVLSDPLKSSGVIRFASGVDPCWEQGGRMLAWTFGNRFYRIRVDKIVAAAEKAATSQPAFWSHPFNFVDVRIAPDEVIAPNLVVAPFYGKGVIALKNARILTMKGTEVIERGIIVIRDGRFEAVGPVGSVKIPVAAESFDLGGATIIPGLVDVHLHLPVSRQITPQQSWIFQANLAYGVTTARDPSQVYEAFGYVDLLKTGQMIGPRLFTVGYRVNGTYRLDDLGDARQIVQERTELGGIVLKNYLAPEASRRSRQWLAIACKEAGLNMTNEGYSYPQLQWGMLKDGSTGIEHNPQWSDVYNDVTTLYARARSWLTPTLQVTGEGIESIMPKEYFKFRYWHNPDEKLRRFTISDSTDKPKASGAESIEAIEAARSQDSLYPNLLAVSSIDARIRHAGGKVTLGSHGQASGIGTHNELWALQLGGLTNMEALQAGTIMGAEALGVQRDLGSLEVGKIADLIVLNKNPLDDIHNSREIRYVMKDGVLYDGNTLDEIWPVAKKCPEWRMPADRQEAK